MDRRIADFLTWGRRRRRWADTTCDGYRLRVGDWLEWCKTQGVRDARATTKDVQAWMDTLHPTVAVHSSAYNALLAWFDWQVDLGRKTNPVHAIDRLAVRRTAPRSLEDDEVRAVLASAASLGPAIHCYIGWMLYAGLRRAEACSLRWVDIEGKDAWVRVLGKGAQERMLPIHDELRGLIVRHRSAGPRPVWLFPGRHGDGPVCVATGTHWARRVFDGAGLPHATGHQLRHSYASSLVQRGWDLPTVMDALGHASLSSTTVYTRSRPARVAEAVASLKW